MSDEEYWKKRCKEKESEIERLREQHKRGNNYLQLFGYGGISIPLDAEMKKRITNFILKEVRMMVEQEDMEQKFVEAALNYKNAFTRIFTPVVKDIIEDLDFNVSFNSHDEVWDDDEY